MNEQPQPAQQGLPGPLKAGAPGFLWGLVGLMAAIELALTLSDAGCLGATDWRWSAFTVAAFWQPIFSGAVEPFYPGQKLVMLISYAFLHGGILHLTMNGIVLLSLGKLAAFRIGAAKTLLVLLLSAVGGALAFGLLSTSNGPMIGASGAVFGLLGLWQAWDYQFRKRNGLSLRPVLTTIMGLIAANILLFAVFSGGLAWEAHLGGWLVGWLAAPVLSGRAARF